MKLIVTIQVVKNGYLVAYPSFPKKEKQPEEMMKYVPLESVPMVPNFGFNIPSSIEEHRIVTDEREIVDILVQLRQSLEQE